jgi:hypothetical protein
MARQPAAAANPRPSRVTSVLAPRIPKIPKSRKSTPPAELEPPGTEYWQCPDCIYRIALDFPSGCDAAIRAHVLAHLEPVEIPLSEKAKAWIRNA